MKFGLVLLKTRTINFHLSEAFGSVLILEQDDISCNFILSQPIPPSLRHGTRHDALAEAYNAALSVMKENGISQDAIQRLVWDDKSQQYREYDVS
jgi:ABC-type amino acid transport substrate-binding protein